MSGTALDPRLTSARSAPRRRIQLRWSDPRFRSVVWQVLVIGIVVAIVWYLAANTNRNLAARRIATGFAFLSRIAGVPIGETLIPYNPALDTYGTALLIGVLNTLKVSIVGIVLATIWGTLVGIGRLSRNWLLAKLTAVYVEVLRDTPVLLQLLFWYALLQGLPSPRQSLRLGQSVFLSNRGMKLPVPVWNPALGWALLAFAAGALGTYGYVRMCRRRQEATGVRPPAWPIALGLLIVFPTAVWAALGSPFTLDTPVLRGFNFVGGLTVSPEYFALLLGLTVYTSAYIAEIVRSGIEAVPQGQWEAAGALGLHRGQILRRIVLPQALRVIIPPLTSQYLNLTKNSSLAVAIGYQDIVSIANTTLNQTGQAIESVAIIMAVYSDHQSFDQSFHELVQRAHRVGGALSPGLLDRAPSPPAAQIDPVPSVAGATAAPLAGRERPPAAVYGPWAWARLNLFGSWWSTAITLALGYLLIRWAIGLIEWAVVDAVWTVPYNAQGAPDPTACQAAKGTGACWAVIEDKYRFILFGRYPYTSNGGLRSASPCSSAFMSSPGCDASGARNWSLLWLATLAVIGILMWGGVFGLTFVPRTAGADCRSP